MSGVVLGREHWYAALTRRWNRAWSDPDDVPPTIYLRRAGGSGTWVVVEPDRGVESQLFNKPAEAHEHAQTIHNLHGWSIVVEQNEGAA